MNRFRVLAALFFTVLSFPVPAWASPTIRVEILRASTVELSCPEEFNVSLPGGQPIFLGRFATFRSDAGGISVNGRVFKAESVKIEPHGIIQVNKHHYRGMIRLQRDSQLLEVLNVLELEKYLYSVIGSEVSARWPAEALKAQAVVARTYALEKMDERKSLPFDVVASYQDQAYEGTEGESSSTEEAVNVTRGEVLAYHDQIITAYYHADCGGHTENGSNVFPGDLPYLKSVADPYGHDSPYQHWTKSYSLAELSERLGSTIQKVSISKDPESGRVRTVTLETPSGKEELAGFQFRKLLGTRDLRSTQFEMEESLKTVYVPKEEILPPKYVTEYVSTEILKSKNELSTESLSLGGKVYLIHRLGALLDVDVSSANPLVAISNGGFLYTIYQDLAARTLKMAMVSKTLLVPYVTQGPERKKTVWVPMNVPVAVTFNGKGWGHGVGLCQWGSRGMALSGKSYEEILHYFYQDVQLKKAYP